MSVYFITCREARAVKIGCSTDAMKRVKEVQWGCPLPVKLEAVVPGGFETERALHGQFADARLTGEWFSLTPVLEAMIAANPAPSEEMKRAYQYYRAPRSESNVAARTRAKLEITQGEMAARLGLEVKEFRKYEYGKPIPGALQADIKRLTKGLRRKAA